jgi:hypothetical protein
LQGPGAHIRVNAFRYNAVAKRELARISRIRELQNRFLGFWASIFVAVMVGVSNVAMQAIFKDMLSTPDADEGDAMQLLA